MNYSKFKSEEYDKFHKQLQELVEERKALRMYYVTIYNLLFALRMQVYGGCR